MISAPPRADGEAQYRRLHAAAMMAFVCVGLYASAFGPALPFIAEDMGVSLDTAGLILTVFFCGSIAASAAVALALHGRETRLLAAWGLASATAGLALLAFAPNWEIALLAGVILGIGDGLLVASLHILMSMTSRDVPAAINRLNLFFAFGAVAGPLWAGAILATVESRAIVYAGIGAFSALTLALMIAASGPIHERIAAPDEPFRLPGHATAWVMGVVLFLYVGAEFGLGSWVSTYARETTDATVWTGALLTAGYWGALMLGRVVSTVWFARGHGASLLLLVSIVGAAIASLALAVATGDIAVAAAAAFGTGLCLGPIWPSILSISAEGSAAGNTGRSSAGGNAASATAVTVTVGNAGGIALPWLQGRILVDAGAAEGVFVTSVLCVLMFVIVIGFRRRSTVGVIDVVGRADGRI